MNRRRGEANFVAVRLGFWHDARVLRLAKELGVEPGMAGSFVLRWEELVLEEGDARTGRVKGYTADLLASHVGWKGRVPRLIDGLKRMGVLAVQRQTLFHPYWPETRTGEYAARRAADARRHRISENDASAFRGGSAEAPGSLMPDSEDVPRNTVIKEGRDSAEAPPQPPPQAGGELGMTRWEWLAQHHERPRNKPLCVRLLAELNDEEWALCQFALTLRRRGGGAYIGRKKRAWLLSSDVFLRTRAFEEFLPEWSKKLEQQNAPQPEPSEQPAAKNGADYIVQALADPEMPEPRKRKLREAWLKRHPDETPPWEVH